MKPVGVALTRAGFVFVSPRPALGYVLIAVVAFWEPLRAVYLIPLCGTWANVLFGYCPLARSLTLMSWNRSELLTADQVWRTIITPPTRGRFQPVAPVVATDGWATTTGELGA